MSIFFPNLIRNILMKICNHDDEHFKGFIMPITIAEYYVDELADWSDAISFYNHEMEGFSTKLEEVISRNSIVGIAEKVEAQQTQINRISAEFHKLQNAIQLQQGALKTNSTLIDNSLISNETENRQYELRRNMQAIEKEYIDVKFDCYHFLSGTLKKHNDR